MATLDDLIRENLTGLLDKGPQGYEDQLYNKAATDIGHQQQGLLETLFGRGMGRSSEGGVIARQVGEALAKARVDASTAARQATLAALAQASGQQNRQQQESQYGRTLAFNKDQAHRNESIANKQLVAQGVGGLGGGALTLGGLLYGKELKGLASGLFSDKPPTGNGAYMNGPGGTYEGPPSGINQDAVVQPDVGGNFDTSIPDLNISTPAYDLSNSMNPSNFSLDVPGFNFDLSNLLRPNLDLGDTGGF